MSVVSRVLFQMPPSHVLSITLSTLVKYSVNGAGIGHENLRRGAVQYITP